MIWVGLTGGIASGKSTVSKYLRQEGAFIVDADKIVHALLLEDRDVYKSILDVFGDEILDPEKKIDRKRLGDLVFRDPDLRKRLNGIVHPFVFQKAEAEKKTIVARYPQSVIVFDAALLIETEAHRKMDWILLAYADPLTQIRRLVKRDHLCKQEAALRIGAQMPIGEKIPYADEVIDCNQSRHNVKAAIHQVYGRLVEKAKRGEPSA